jgi:arylsulfatase
MGSRGIYDDGWYASAFGPRAPWVQGIPVGMSTWNPENDQWELYNVDDDPTELNDLAKSNPAKLAEMQPLFDQEAKANQVYPLINWSDLFPGFKKFQEQVRNQKK